MSEMSLNKYVCHIVNMTYTTHMLNKQTDPTYLHIFSKIQPNATVTLHIIAKYITKTNISYELPIKIYSSKRGHKQKDTGSPVHFFISL